MSGYRHMFVRIPFQAFNLPGGGFGVKTVLKAKGAYAVSEDTKKAQRSFPYVVRLWILEKGLLSPRTDEALVLEEPVSWREVKRRALQFGLLRFRIVDRALLGEQHSRARILDCFVTTTMFGEVVAIGQDQKETKEIRAWLQKAFTEDIDFSNYPKSKVVSKRN